MDHSSIPEGTAGTGEAFREGMEADERECELPTWTRAHSSVRDRPGEREDGQEVERFVVGEEIGCILDMIETGTDIWGSQGDYHRSGMCSSDTGMAHMQTRDGTTAWRRQQILLNTADVAILTPLPTTLRLTSPQEDH